MSYKTNRIRFFFKLQTKRITQFQSKIGKIIKEEQANIVQSYTEFKKAVLHVFIIE